MSSSFRFYNAITAVAALAFLAACDPYTTAQFTPTTSDAAAHRMMEQYTKDARYTMQITDDYIDRPNRVVGNVSASARALFPWSPDPTPEDLNEALQAEAISKHADAVMDVDYRSDKTTFSEHGLLLGSGIAIVYLNRDRTSPPTP